MKILILVFLIITIVSSKQITRKIAIIGSGIGGLSSAYFLFKSHKNLSIDIYEKNDHLGGRMSTFDANGIKVDLGASFFIKENKLINEIIEYSNVEIIKAFNKNEKNIAILDSNLKTLITLDGGFYRNMFKLLTNYKLGIFDLNTLANKFISNMGNVYSYLDLNEYYEKTLGLIEKLGFINEYKNSLLNEMKDKVNYDMLTNFIQPLIISCYNQNLEINALAGSIIIVAAVKEAYKIKEGFGELIEKLSLKLIKEYNLKVILNKEVKLIKKIDNKYLINGILYDDVIIAANTNLNNIEFLGFSNLNSKVFPKVSFKTTEILIKGRIDFNSLNLNQSTDYTTILFKEQLGIDKQTISDIIKVSDNLYKIQISIENVKENSLKWLFINGEYEIIKTKYWKDPYPNLKPITDPTTVLNFKLIENERIFYNNAIEQIVSCIEMIVVSAKNTSNMILDSLIRKEDELIKTNKNDL